MVDNTRADANSFTKGFLGNTINAATRQNVIAEEGDSHPEGLNWANKQKALQSI
ncbi:MAG: hypothetical protein QXL96_12285 [Ignisphaera sp.]